MALAATVVLLRAPRPEGSTAAAAPVALPSALTAAEEASPACATLARRFNPAMALPDVDGPWPVPVSYSWSDGADLMARTIGPDGRTLSESIARPGGALDHAGWADLPVRDRRDNLIQYWVDGPGDDSATGGYGPSAWRRRW